MKNLHSKLLHYLENNKQINPSKCQINVISKVDDLIKNNNKIKIFKSSKNQSHGIYIYGSVGVGKSVLLKALSDVLPDSELMHFNDLIFNLQSKNKIFFKKIKELKKKRLILIDEFFINNLTILILFKNFLDDFEKLKIPIVMSGNNKLVSIYDDPVNPILCKNIKAKLESYFSIIKIRSKVDHRKKNEINHDFYFISQKKSTEQQKLIKKLSNSNNFKEKLFIRRGNSFRLDKIYDNLIELEFESFFKKNLIFQDYEIVAKEIKIFVLRNIIQMDETSKNFLTRFISFVDVLYENKNILSISTDVELEKLYLGTTNANEFKRTISRLTEMGSNNYINKYIKQANEISTSKL